MKSNLEVRLDYDMSSTEYKNPTIRESPTLLYETKRQANINIPNPAILRCYTLLRRWMLLIQLLKAKLYKPKIKWLLERRFKEIRPLYFWATTRVKIEKTNIN